MYIVTGAAGFIGSNIVRGLNRAGIDDILAVDDLGQGDKHRNLNRCRIADYCDYRDLETELGKLEKIDAILHQGACAVTTEHDGRYMMEVNYRYSKMLLQAAAERQAPFLYASSASVYGDGDEGFREDPACEYPLNVYAYSKFQFDNFLRRRWDELPNQVVGLRYFNVYGPQENHKQSMASVIWHWHNQITDGGVLKPFAGSENFRRDFVFVDDVVAVNLHFLLEATGTSGIYNCGTGKARSFLDIADIMVGLYDGARIEAIPFPDHLEGKYQAFTEADLTQLRDGGGYGQAFTELEDGVKAYVEVLREHGGYWPVS